MQKLGRLRTIKIEKADSAVIVKISVAATADAIAVAVALIGVWNLDTIVLAVEQTVAVESPESTGGLLITFLTPPRDAFPERESFLKRFTGNVVHLGVH